MPAGPAGSIGRALCLAFAGLVPLLATPAAAQDVSCRRGDREVVGVSFEGNRAFSDAQLALRVVTTPSDWFRRKLRLPIGTKRCLNEDELANDIARLRSFYKERGYYGAAVDTLVRAVRPSAVKVSFRVTEGPPTLVDSLAISGLDSLPQRNEILRDLNLRIARPFGLVPLLADIDSIKSRMRNAGYPDVDVLNGYNVRAAQQRAEVNLTVLPGPRARFGAVQLQVTPGPGKRAGEIPARVVRKLVDIDSGSWYSDRALESARRNLYGTGAYRHVEVSTQLDTTPAQRDTIVPVHVNVVEDLMREVNGEVGWATLDCFRTTAQYTDKNFLSSARQFDVSGRLSKIGFAPPTATRATQNLCPDLVPDTAVASRLLNYSLNATLRQPTIGGRAVATYSLYRERRGEYLAYLRTTLIGGEAALSKSIARGTPARIGYSLEYGRTEAQRALLCAVFSRCTAEEQDAVKQNQRLAVASFAVTRDRTDNPLSPTAGTILRGEVRGSSPFLGSDSSLQFLKGTADGVWYHRVFGGLVLATRVRGGAIAGGATSHGTRLPPPQERLYAGGANSVRGFQQNQLGPLVYLADSIVAVPAGSGPAASVQEGDTVFLEPGRRATRVVPVGGNSLFVANIDLRFRDPFVPDVLQYNLFLDAGQVWTRQRNDTTALAKFGLHPLYYTPGVGVRYFSPVGPIQVNVGYNPYGAQSGVAYYESPPSATGAVAPLYCVSPATRSHPVVPKYVVGPVDPKTGRPTYAQVDSTVNCPESYAPPPSRTPLGRIFNRITFTLSIGSDF